MKTYSIAVRVTQQELDDILDAAFAGSGVSYWVGALHMITPRSATEPIKAMSEGLTRGRYFMLFDEEAEKWQYLTLKKFRRGLALALQNGFDLDNFDGPAADSVVQYALFGKEVYA